jgi:hypothetical protein
MSLKRINVYISEKAYNFLKESEGTISENVRSAINEYIRLVRELEVSASQSKRKESE